MIRNKSRKHKHYFYNKSIDYAALLGSRAGCIHFNQVRLLQNTTNIFLLYKIKYVIIIMTLYFSCINDRA